LNIANLLLARASGCRQEIAVRSALGASRPRIVAQMLTESMLLSLIGGLAGIATDSASLRPLLRFIPRGIPRLTEVNLDWRVLLFALLISVVTGLIFGLARAVHATRSNLLPGIRENSRGAGAKHFRDVLVISELALAVVLMTGSLPASRTGRAPKEMSWWARTEPLRGYGGNSCRMPIAWKPVS
jgi:hypothetical protein